MSGSAVPDLCKTLFIPLYLGYCKSSALHDIVGMLCYSYYHFETETSQ